MKRWQILLLLAVAAAGGAALAPDLGALGLGARVDLGTRPMGVDPGEPRPAEPGTRQGAEDALVLLLDTSCSMGLDGRLDAARRAIASAARRVDPETRFSLVTFDDRARIVVPAATGAAEGLAAVVGRLREDGGSNLAEGLAAARDELGGPGRILLVTDGAANVGDTEPAAFAAAGRELGAAGVRLSVLGLGPDVDEALLQRMAEASGGTYEIVRGPADLPGALEAVVDVRHGGRP